MAYKLSIDGIMQCGRVRYRVQATAPHLATCATLLPVVEACLVGTCQLPLVPYTTRLTTTGS